MSADNRTDTLAMMAALYRIMGHERYSDMAVDAMVWAETVGINEVLRRVRLHNCPPGPEGADQTDTETEAYRQGRADERRKSERIRISNSIDDLF